jgi:DNA polymerase I
MPNDLRLVIDCNNLCYRALHTVGGLDNGIVFGFMSQMLTLTRQLKSSQIVFCWDSRKSYRKEQVSNYKEKPPRAETEQQELEEAFLQFVKLRKEVLPALGFKNVLMQTGYEADDLMAHVVQRFPGNYIIVSGDEDLYQLLYEDRFISTKIYQPIKKKLVTTNGFFKKYGIMPDKWSEVKALAGCSSDHVIGIEGVGEITAIKFLKDKLNSGKILERIEEQKQEMMDRNFSLVHLPFSGDRPINTTELYEDTLYSLDFLDTFDRFDLKSFLSEKTFEKWEESFDLNGGRRSA